MGKGRSGTSLVANILYNLGVNMGDEMKETMSINPKGFFENLEILNLTRHIMMDAKCAETLNNLDTEKAEKRVLAFRNKYDKIIKKVVRNNESELWGWKDERSCFAIKLFLPHLTNPHFIIVHRNMYSIARSLENIDNLPITDGLLSAISFYKKIFEFLKEVDYPRMHISYEELFTNGDKVVQDLCDFIGIKRKKIEGVIDKDLRHFI